MWLVDFLYYGNKVSDLPLWAFDSKIKDTYRQLRKEDERAKYKIKKKEMQRMEWKQSLAKGGREINEVCKEILEDLMLRGKLKYNRRLIELMRNDVIDAYKYLEELIKKGEISKETLIM